MSAFTLIQSLTLDKLGFWEYLARFSLDKFINGPSGLVNIEAWRKRKKLIYKYAWPLTHTHSCTHICVCIKKNIKFKIMP